MQKLSLIHICPVANQVTAHTFVKGAASNYAVEYVDGTLTMVPSTTEVTVTITGNHDSRVYNASEQSVTGFTTDVGTKTISVVLADGSEAVAKGTGAVSYTHLDVYKRQPLLNGWKFGAAAPALLLWGKRGRDMPWTGNRRNIFLHKKLGKP